MQWGDNACPALLESTFMSSSAVVSVSAFVRQRMDVYPARAAYLLAALEDVQSGLGYVPEDAIEPVAAYFHVSCKTVHDLIEDCKSLQVSPQVNHVLHVCQGPLCSASGGRDLADKAREAIGTCGDVQIVGGYCLGHCHEAPVAKLDNLLVCRATPDDVVRQLQRLNAVDADR